MSQCKYTYSKHIDEWHHLVKNKQVLVCKEQHGLMKLIETELARPEVSINHTEIHEAIELIEKYFPFRLFNFQKFFLSFVVGVYEKDHLLFDEYFYLGGRGIGKNGLISAISFYLISDKNNIQYYDIDIIANSEDQAKISFNEIYNLLETDKEIMKKYFYWIKTEITNTRNRSTLRYKTSNSKSGDGRQPGAIIFDEIHQYEDYDNIKVHTSGLGKKENPRTFLLTTDGYVRGSVLDDYKNKANDIFKGEWPHNGFFPFIFKLDTIKEADSSEMWSKANPRILYDNTLQRQINKEYVDSQRNSERKEDFLTKRMNWPYESKEKVVASWEDIMATKEHVWPDFTGHDCIGAVDFADIDDFVSVGLLFKKNGMRYFKEHTFIHEKSLQVRKYKFPIDEAVKSGWATIIRNKSTIPVSAVTDWFFEEGKKYNIKKVVADYFRATALQEGFDGVGLTLETVRSGSISHGLVAPLIDTLFLERRLAFEDNKLMRWYTNNVGVETDKKGNKTYIKIEPELRKTDGFFNFVHAMIRDHELEEAHDIVHFDIIM